jgi:hypothetical protein
MDAARSTSWSSLPPCAVPVAGACAASPCLTGSDLRSVPGLVLRLCCICIRTGQLPRRTHRHGRPSQGGFEQRSAHPFAEMVQAFAEEEKTTTSAKARLQSITAAAHILRPKLSIPAVVGLCHICIETSLASYASAPDRASIPGGPAPPCRICDRSYVEIAAAQHPACTAARARGGWRSVAAGRSGRDPTCAVLL